MQRKSIIGEVPMFEEGIFPAHCMAMSDCVLLSLKRIHLLKLIQEDPQIALKMLAFQAQRLREFIEKIEGLSFQKTEKKLVNYILKKGTSCGDHVSVSIQDMTTEDLAHYLGTTREHLSRAVKRLTHKNVLKKSKKKSFSLNLKTYREVTENNSDLTSPR